MFLLVLRLIAIRGPCDMFNMCKHLCRPLVGFLLQHTPNKLLSFPSVSQITPKVVSSRVSFFEARNQQETHHFRGVRAPAKKTRATHPSLKASSLNRFEAWRLQPTPKDLSQRCVGPKPREGNQSKLKAGIQRRVLLYAFERRLFARCKRDVDF